MYQYSRRPLVENVPTLGVYGKVGDTKGTFDLIRSLGHLAEEGVGFNLVILAAGEPHTLARVLTQLERSPSLRSRTWMLPTVAPWQVPRFVAGCDAVLFLERSFSIAFHGSQIPREVLAMESCLVVSAETASRSIYGGSLADRRTCMVVDPQDDTAMVSSLRQCLSDMNLRRGVAKGGKWLSDYWEGELPSLEERATDFENGLRAML
jgi:hypothetical protein